MSRTVDTDEKPAPGITRRTVLAGTALVGSAAALGLLRPRPALTDPRPKPRWIGHM